MDELIVQLAPCVGLTPAPARQAAETLLGVVKTRLPAPPDSHVDQRLGESGGGGRTGETAGGGLRDLTEGLGGMFGR